MKKLASGIHSLALLAWVVCFFNIVESPSDEGSHLGIYLALVALALTLIADRIRSHAQ